MVCYIMLYVYIEKIVCFFLIEKKIRFNRKSLYFMYDLVIGYLCIFVEVYK